MALPRAIAGSVFAQNTALVDSHGKKEKQQRKKYTYTKQKTKHKYKH